jgi:hypothetical protein
MLLGDIVIFDKEKVGIYIGNDVILYPDKDILKEISYSKIENKVNMVRRIRDMKVSDYTLIFNELMKYRNNWFRRIFKPKKLNYEGITFIAYLFDLIHIIIKFNFKQVTFNDIKFSIKFITVFERGIIWHNQIQ